MQVDCLQQFGNRRKDANGSKDGGDRPFDDVSFQFCTIRFGEQLRCMNGIALVNFFVDGLNRSFGVSLGHASFNECVVNFEFHGKSLLEKYRSLGAQFTQSGTLQPVPAVNTIVGKVI
jgi:hypothetical protein